MKTDYIAKKIRPHVVDGKLTYDDFEKIFGFMPRKEQYPIAYAIQDELHIELVDEINSPPPDDDADDIADEKNFPLIIKDAREIKVPNKFLIRLIQDGDEQARQDLCIKNQRLVGKYAVKYQKIFPNTLDFDDLMQEGYAGMLKAAENFDFDRDSEFSTYAVWWIVQSITRAIYDTGLTVRLPVHIVEKILRASRLDTEFQLRDISLRERLELIAAEMETTSEEVRKLFTLREIYLHMISLDTPVDEDHDTPLGDLVVDEKNFLEDNMMPILLREQLDAALATLTEREREVLILRFGLEDGQTRTLEEVGKSFNVTRERIRQIEAKALRKLRHPARSKNLRDFLD